MLLLALLVLAGVSGCARSAPATPHKLTIAISGYAYHPTRVTVLRGAQISFVNDDTTAHTATTSTAGFDTGTIKAGQSRTVTLDKPGTYTYACQFHPFMQGQIAVSR